MSSDSEDPPLVRLSGVTHVYESAAGGVKAVDGVSLNIQRGEFVSIMGESGAGKSTLLSVMGAMNTPSQGRYVVDDLDVYSLSNEQQADFRREYLGFVFQSFHLVPYLTVMENVMLPLRYSRVSRAEGRRRAIALLEQVGLGDRYTHRPAELSGGEQQRVAVARALVNHPAIVLGDEPTGELDTHTAAEIMTLLHDLNQNQGQTFITVTHDPGVAKKTDRTIYLSDGMVLREERRK